jgi:hypothetical protein
MPTITRKYNGPGTFSGTFSGHLFRTFSPSCSPEHLVDMSPDKSGGDLLNATAAPRLNDPHIRRRRRP